MTDAQTSCVGAFKTALEVEVLNAIQRAAPWCLPKDLPFEDYPQAAIAALKESLQMSTGDAFECVRTMGYDGTRERLDYFLSRELIERPPKEGALMRWSFGHVIAFAAELARVRAFLPGCHKEEQTAWESDEDLEQLQWSRADHERLGQLDVGELLSELVNEADASRLHALSYLLDARLPKASPWEVFALLGDLERTDTLTTRRALAAEILRVLNEAAEA